MSHRTLFQTFHIPYLATVLAICGLFLSLGCAPKVIIQSEPVSPPVRGGTPKSAISVVLLNQFQAWKGVPHRVGGADRRGVDCSGLMQIVFREAFGLDLPRTSRQQIQLGRKVETRDMRPGDLVYFEDKGGDHVGVIVEKRVFLHASSTLGVTLSELDAYWWPRLRRVQRLLS